MKNKRHNIPLWRRWGARALTLLLACALLAGLAITASARGGDEWQGQIVDPVVPMPVVTLQGNLVTERGKPTGFYELALCVRSGRIITANINNADITPGTVVSEADYENYLAANPTVAEDPTAVFDFQYFPFKSASTAAWINTDILTAVNWNLQSVTYETFDAGTNGYPKLDAAALPGAVNYPRGIDPDPAVQGYDPAVLSREDAFPDITTPSLDLVAGLSPSVALDVENDPRMFTAEGVAEHFENNAALITLSASAPDNYPVILKESTPLVVARFSYDLKRFDTTKVSTALSGMQGQRNSITGDAAAGAKGLWMGWDKTTGFGDNTFSGKQALTWLGQSDAGALYDFSYSDELAAATQADQTVWVHTATNDAATLDTYFYYYLGAEDYQNSGPDSIWISDGAGGTQEVKNVTIPATEGYTVLTQGTDQNTGTPPADYTYFKNLLRLGDKTLVVKLVNEPTFKKPTGAGGNIILFYDWDDTLIGSLAVDKGDVRAEVEAYVEENLVHPELRPGSSFMDDGAGNTDVNKLSSLERQYTYRGKYAYTVGGDDATLGVADGKEYPLTNKLDYVFTKRVNTVLTQEENGAKVQYVHPYSLNDPALDPTVRDNDAAEYPYAYGWAVVEDTRAFNGNPNTPTGATGPWKTMHDAAKLEDTWTTMGTGELSNTRRATLTATSLPTVPTVDPLAERTAPAFLKDADPAWTDGTLGDNYAYKLSGQNGYLRFADFSDITAELNRYSGKNTLIVKAVYEEGTSLMNGYNYTAITKPAYTKWNNVAAKDGGSYKVQMTVERSYVQDGQLRGTTRIRMPVIQQDTTIDYKWLSDPEKGVNNDLTNTSYDVSNTKEETLYTQVDTDNGEEITFSLALSARQNRLDYVLVERYGLNFVVGTQRSSTNNIQKTSNPDMFIPDNYNYLAGNDSDTQDDLYDPDFATKEGSHGFVLYGTLGHFLEQATKYHHEEIDRDAYENAVTYTPAMDANLRMNLGGAQPEFMDNSKLQEAFLAAAKACEAHKNDPAYDCWDPNLDSAKLTYHQAQLFLIDFQSNPGADILTVAAADAQKLPFCHYHVKCSGGHIPSPPTGWKALIETVQAYNDAAPGSDDRKNADADLGAMELSALEAMTNLRADNKGTKFSDLSTFLTALKKADVELRTVGATVNWPNLQYAILHGAAGGSDALMRDEAQDSYWWYAGATSAPPVTTFAELLAAAEATYVPVTLPDADATFLPKSALKAGAFPDNARDYLTEASPTRLQRNAWFTLTENLIPGAAGDPKSHRRVLDDPDGDPTSGDESYQYIYEKYADFDTFLTDFSTAYDALRVTHPADADAWWQAIQTKLLRDEDPADNLGDYDGDGSTKFWWRNGNTPFRVMNLTTLVECARRLNGPSGAEKTAAQAEWDRLKVADIESVAISQGLRWRSVSPATGEEMYPQTGADLGGNEATQKFQILFQLQRAVESFDKAAAADPSLVMNWDSLQYILLNPGATPTTDAIRNQRTYYWWRDGQTEGTTVVLNIGAKGALLDLNLQALVRATYRAAFNDLGVTKSLTDEANAAGGSFWDYIRLAKSYDKGTKFPRDDDATNPNANDTYAGPDVITDLSKYDYAAGDLNDMMAMLTRFRDAAKAAQGISTAGGNYDMPTVSWQQVQYYMLNGETYISTSSQTFRDLYDKEKAKYGDYWWYYLDERVPPDPPKQDVPDPPTFPALDAAVGDIQAALDSEDPETALQDLADSLTTDMIADWGVVNLDGTPVDDDGLAAIQDRLVNGGLMDELAGAGVSLGDMGWPQLQLLFSTAARDWYWYITATEEEALDYLVNSEGGMLVADGGYIPDEYGQIYPEIFGLAFSLRSAEQPADLSALGELVVDAPTGDVGADVPIGPDAPTENAPAGDVEDDLPTTTTTTVPLPDGGVIVTTVVTGVDGYVTTITTRIPLGGVASTTTVITPPETQDPAEGVGADVPIVPGPENFPQSPAATAPSTEGAPGDGDTSQVSPEEPKEDVGGGIPDAPALDLDANDPAQDPDMATAVPETPLGEEAAAALSLGDGPAALRPVLALPAVDRRRETVLYFDPRWHGWVQSQT